MFHVGLIFMLISTQAYHHHSRIDVNVRKCKLTHSGIEYQGTVFTTKFKSLCRPWNSIGVSTKNSRDNTTIFKSNKTL